MAPPLLPTPQSCTPQSTPAPEGRLRGRRVFTQPRVTWARVPASPRVTRRPYHPERLQRSCPRQREHPARLPSLTLRQGALTPRLHGRDPLWTMSHRARASVAAV